MSLFDSKNKKFVCEEMKRRNAKTIEKWEKFVNENVNDFLTDYINGDYNGIVERIKMCA